jgi:hypothetical protein
MRRVRPGACARLRWAIQTGRRPVSCGALLRLWWADFVLHPLFEAEERCQDCGRRYPAWGASCDLYAEVCGSLRGTLCPGCFDRRAGVLGIAVRFQARRIKNDPEQPERAQVSEGTTAVTDQKRKPRLAGPRTHLCMSGTPRSPNVRPPGALPCRHGRGRSIDSTPVQPHGRAPALAPARVHPRTPARNPSRRSVPTRPRAGPCPLPSTPP